MHTPALPARGPACLHTPRFPGRLINHTHGLAADTSNPNFGQANVEVASRLESAHSHMCM